MCYGWGILLRLMNKRQSKKRLNKALQDIKKGKSLSIIVQAIVNKNGKPCNFYDEGARLILYKRPQIRNYVCVNSKSKIISANK